MPTSEERVLMAYIKEKERVKKIIREAESNVSIDKQVESGCIIGLCILAGICIILGATLINHFK